MATLVCLFVQPLIHPIPDEAALQAGMIAKRLPVMGIAPRLLPMAWAYSHRISGRVSWQADPLAERPLGHRREGLILVGAGIHGADDVGGRGVGPAPSYCTGRLGSLPLTQRYMASWAGP